MNFKVGDRIESIDGFDVAQGRKYGFVQIIERYDGIFDYGINFDDDPYSDVDVRWRHPNHLKLTTPAVEPVDECAAFFS